MDDTKNTFDKSLFSELIQKAKGERTMTKFADDAGTSVSHISRMINAKLESPPSPETIKKLVPTEKNGVTYEDLMIAAGHINKQQLNLFEDYKDDIKYDDIENNNNNEQENSEHPFNNERKNRFEKMKLYESLCMSTILYNLRNYELDWRVAKDAKRDFFRFDLTLELSNNSIDTWLFDFRYIDITNTERFSRSRSIATHYAMNTWSKLILQPISSNSKITVVTDCEIFYDSLLKVKPHNLNLNISIILVDINELKILKEEYVSYNNTIDKESLNELLLS